MPDTLKNLPRPSRPRLLALAIALSSVPSIAMADPVASISSISPNSGPTHGGTLITLVGSDFGASNTVTIGGTPASVMSSTSSAIIASTPPGQGADLPVVITTGGASSNSVSFSYDPPAIDSISPTTAPTTGSKVITLIGSSFGLSPTVTVSETGQ